MFAARAVRVAMRWDSAADVAPRKKGMTNLRRRLFSLGQLLERI